MSRSQVQDTNSSWDHYYPIMTLDEDQNLFVVTSVIFSS